MVPVSLDVPGLDTDPNGQSSAAAFATAPIPENISNQDIFKLVQHLVASTEQVQNQVGKIDVLANKMSELAINQSNMSAQVVGMEGRIDSIDSRFIKLEERKRPRIERGVGITHLSHLARTSTHADACAHARAQRRKNGNTRV